MKVIDLDIDTNEYFKTAVGLGNFDGIHIGHQELIRKTVEESKERNLTPALLLFNNHTNKVIKNSSPEILTTNEDKMRLAKDLGIELIFKLNFTEEIMKLSKEDFIREIIVDKMKSDLVVVGFDYTFGYGAEGKTGDLKRYENKYDYDTLVVDPIFYGDMIVSSSYIRELIKSGNVEKANILLNRMFSITGFVERGDRRGTKLGFPTANINTSDLLIIPKIGVYETLTKIGSKKYRSITDIGYNPTFGGNKIKIETHILDFSENIYSKKIKLLFKNYIRDDIKFDSREELIIQLNKDVETVREGDE